MFMNWSNRGSTEKPITAARLRHALAQKAERFADNVKQLVGATSGCDSVNRERFRYEVYVGTCGGSGAPCSRT